MLLVNPVSAVSALYQFSLLLRQTSAMTFLLGGEIHHSSAGVLQRHSESELTVND